MILANNRAKELSLELGDSVASHTCHQLLHQRATPCSGEEHPCPLKQVIETHKPVKLVHHHYNAQHQIRTLEIQATPYLDQSGEVSGIIESVRDITDRITIQNELVQKQKSLDYLAHHDPLTELPNRLLFFDRLQQSLHIAHRSGSKGL